MSPVTRSKRNVQQLYTSPQDPEEYPEIKSSKKSKGISLSSITNLKTLSQFCNSHRFDEVMILV